ncbi:MAG: hypothetical protein P8H03_06710 [Emcibacteraceae bacterium]|nr:hypothetical protein [Emcibacteraceae bacterium]MDG1859852.1 hypothetical protein [Emcibacteraceae bacterium]
MKHFKTNKLADTDLYDKLDYYDYSEFDDDYYYDMVNERANSKHKQKKPGRKSSRYAHAFHDYVKDY